MSDQVVFESAKNYYAVDYHKLLEGDVILTTNQESLISWTIRKVTNSDFSHAIICTDPPWCVESVGYGVLRFVISRFLIGSRNNINILRLSSRSTRTDLAENAALYADKQVTRKYAWKDALAYPFRSLPQIENGSFFCSQLVAESYRQAKLELVPGKPPPKTSPGDLAQSHEFVNVTSQCLRRATNTDKLNCTGLLDGEEISTPHAEEVLLKQRIMKQLTPTLNKFGVHAGTYDDLLGHLVQGWKRGDSWVPIIDEAFSKAIINSGLLRLLRKYFPSHHDYYFLDVYLTRLLQSFNINKDDVRALTDYYQNALEIRVQSINEAESLALASRKTYILTGLESVRLNGALLEDVQSIRLRQGNILKNCLNILSNLSNLSHRKVSTDNVNLKGEEI